MTISRYGLLIEKIVFSVFSVTFDLLRLQFKSFWLCHPSEWRLQELWGLEISFLPFFVTDSLLSECKLNHFTLSFAELREYFRDLKHQRIITDIWMIDYTLNESMIFYTFVREFSFFFLLLSAANISWHFTVKSTAHNTDFKTMQTAFWGPVLWEGTRKPQEAVCIAAIMSRLVSWVVYRRNKTSI